jgi:kynurenine formamidase
MYLRVKRLIDISQPIFNGAPGYPDLPPAEIIMGRWIPSHGYNLEFLKMHTHFGTHIDSPGHIVEGMPPLSAISLESFMGPAVVIDATLRREDRAITLEDLKRYNDKIARGDIVLIYTGWGYKRGYTTEYMKKYPIIEEEVALWLAEKKVKGVGCEYVSIDGYGTKGAPVHNALLRNGIWILEELFLKKELLEKERWYLIALPMPYEGTYGAQCRAVALEFDYG